MESGLKKISAFDVKGGRPAFFGGNQDWYTGHWMRMSGCGPTAASNIVWYLAQARKELSGLYPINAADQEECLRLMTGMFAFVKPGIGGVKNPAAFAKGLMRYGESQGFSSQSRILKVPMRPFKRPPYEKYKDFIKTSLQEDLPVAFLNYSNGTLRNLGSWHWVTITAFKPEEGLAEISDQGRRKEISMVQWLKTTYAGGALVSVNLH